MTHTVFASRVSWHISFLLSDQIVGDLALGQEGIGGNIFALNIDGIKQRDGGLDFVGAFNLLVGCGQGTYFRCKGSTQF
jgi:hypothetical protein